jgi:uncharacterized membrane protein YfcA
MHQLYYWVGFVVVWVNVGVGLLAAGLWLGSRLGARRQHPLAERAASN